LHAHRQCQCDASANQPSTTALQVRHLRFFLEVVPGSMVLCHRNTKSIATNGRCGSRPARRAAEMPPRLPATRTEAGRATVGRSSGIAVDCRLTPQDATAFAQKMPASPCASMAVEWISAGSFLISDEKQTHLACQDWRSVLSIVSIEIPHQILWQRNITTRIAQSSVPSMNGRPNRRTLFLQMSNSR
jgi:hypothetical protein